MRGRRGRAMVTTATRAHQECDARKKDPHMAVERIPSEGELRDAVRGTPYEPERDPSEDRDDSDTAQVRDAVLAVAATPAHATLVLARALRLLHRGETYYTETNRERDDVDLLERTAAAALADLAQAYERTRASFHEYDPADAEFACAACGAYCAACASGCCGEIAENEEARA